MQTHEVLSEARFRHVSAFVERMAELEPCHVEPAMRLADGSLALSGNPPTPCRMDLIVKATGEQYTADSERPQHMETYSTQIGATTVQVVPFEWSMARVEAHGVGPEARELVRTWFVRWFDLDDENSADGSGLYGVVHYLGDVLLNDGGVAFEVDLGSAPPSAVEDLVTMLSSNGATQVRIS